MGAAARKIGEVLQNLIHGRYSQGSTLRVARPNIQGVGAPLQESGQEIGLKMHAGYYRTYVGKRKAARFYSKRGNSWCASRNGRR